MGLRMSRSCLLTRCGRWKKSNWVKEEKKGEMKTVDATWMQEEEEEELDK